MTFERKSSARPTVARPVDGVIHPEECESHFCPCYQAGMDMRATSHWELLVWLARRDPALLQDALLEAIEKDA